MCRAIELAYVRYQVRDLERQLAFLADFGLAVVVRDERRVYLRGTGTAPFLYELSAGDANHFLGCGFAVGAGVDLDRLAAFEGSGPVEAVTAPGGGRRVRMRMPDGFEIDAVHGVEPARGLGHVVLHVSDHDASVAWLRQRLGLVPSDHLAPPDQPQRIVGSFLRVNRGAALVDHHCLLVLGAGDPGVHHCSFEVADLDAVMSGHDFLQERGWRLDCGVGRHLLGSQVFDYWRDAAGFRIEHYSDGDIVNNEHQPSVFCGSAEETTQWGAKPPPEFFGGTP